jgi:hypothetical protein
MTASQLLPQKPCDEYYRTQLGTKQKIALCVAANLIADVAHGFANNST